MLRDALAGVAWHLAGRIGRMNWLKEHKRFAIVVAVASCAMVAMSAIALYVHSDGPSGIKYLKDLPAREAIFVLTLLLGAVVLAFVMLQLARRLPGWVQKSQEKPARWNLRLSPKPVLICAAIILVCWLPWIWLQYPISNTFDTYNQLYQHLTDAPTYYTTMNVFVDAEYIDHHPVLVTLLYGAFLSLGDLLGSQNYGLFAYNLFQSSLTAVVLAITCCYAADRLAISQRFAAIVVAICALCPLFPQWATYMGKDSLFSISFLAYMICFVEVVRSKGACCKSKTFVAALILASFLSMVSKKPGLYIVAASNIFLLVYCWRGGYRWQSIVQLVAPLAVAVVLVPAIVYPLIGGVAPGGKQETLGVFLQQTVTVVRESDDLSAEEREALEGVLDVDSAVSAYSPTLVDPVKKHFKLDASTGDIVRFFGAWASIGVRHPVEYAKSSLRIASALLAPALPFTYGSTLETYNAENVQNWLIAKIDNPDFKTTFFKPKYLQSAEEGIAGVWRDIAKTPLLGIFFSRGFYGGWLPFICLILVGFFRRRNMLFFIPIVMSMLVAFVCPAVSPRYVLPLVYCMPLMLALACYSAGEAKDSGRKLAGL